MLVLINNVQRHRLGLEGLALGRGPQLDAELVAGLDLDRDLDHFHAVELNHPGFNQLLQIAARELRHASHQRPIQAAGMALDGHADPAQLHLGASVGLFGSLVGQRIDADGARYNQFAQF